MHCPLLTVGLLLPGVRLLLPGVRCMLKRQGFPNSGVDLVSTSSVEPGEACRCKVTATVSGVTTQINAEKNSQRDYALAA